ncbi:MAG: ATP-binding protein, partial [Candidatus Heimdallarchaeota archaeon]
INLIDKLNGSEVVLQMAGEDFSRIIDNALNRMFKIAKMSNIESVLDIIINQVNGQIVIEIIDDRIGLPENTIKLLNGLPDADISGHGDYVPLRNAVEEFNGSVMINSPPDSRKSGLQFVIKLPIAIEA